MSATFAGSVAGLAHGRRRQRRWLAALAVVTALVLTVFAASLGPTGELIVAVGAASALIPILVWRSPLAGLVTFVFACTTIEQYAVNVPPLIVGDGTDQIPLFTSLSAQGFSGLYVTPAEIIIGVLLVIWMLKAGAERRLRLPASPLTATLAIFMLLVTVALVRGVGQGGQLNVALNELRPWLYFTLLYVVASQLVQRRAAVNALLWAFILGTGLKGVQGTYQWLHYRSAVPRPEAILAHEEAFFFGIFILLVVGLWLFREQGRLRRCATALLPFVVVADLGNNRRNSWVILIAGLAVLLCATWVRMPGRRSAVGQFSLAIVVISLVYFPLYWNSTGTLGQPARAIHSILAPSVRDLSSNQYRVLEDANLALNIKRSPIVGNGFGVPIDYSIKLVDLTVLSSMLKYVPHNGALYIWMRLGIIGAIAFWCMIGAGFILAARALRHTDTRVAILGCVALCSLVAYAIQGTFDLGFYWYRVAIFMGCILGAVEGILRAPKLLD